MVRYLLGVLFFFKDPFSMDYSWRDSKNNQEDKSAISEICRIIFQMISEKGKECLQPLSNIRINEKNYYNPNIFVNCWKN